MLLVDPAVVYPNVASWWSTAQPLEIRYALAVKASANYERGAVETRIVEKLKVVTPSTDAFQPNPAG